MDHSNCLPSRPLLWAARCLRLTLWVVVSVWLVFGATLGVVHGFIVPRIDQWRPDLEALATRAVGIPVRIGAIHGSSESLIPSFELTQVRLMGPSGQEALELERVLASVSVTSLLRLGFDQVFIDRPTLDIRRRHDGVVEVAGLPVLGNAPTDGEPSALLDWFFSQSEFAIRSGTVRWTDDMRQQPPVTLNEVDFVVRNPGRQHQFRLDATPGGGLSGRLSMRGMFRSPLFTLQPGNVSEWSGTAYIDMPAVDLALLASPTRVTELLGLTVERGDGALRLWMDIKKGQLTGTTADLALSGVHAKFQQATHPMRLNHFGGRVALTKQASGWEVETDQLHIETTRGTRWRQGKLKALYQPASAPLEVPGQLEVSRIDLSTLHELASALPLPPSIQVWMEELQPSGLIDNLALTWTGNDQAWSRYSAKGQAHALALRAARAPSMPSSAGPYAPPPSAPGRPGFSGASVTFELDESGGKATLGLRDGALEFPGVFEEPRIPLDHAHADLSWSVRDENIQLQVRNARFSNSDLQGQASGTWQTANPGESPSGSRFPGILKLDGKLSRGRGERVHRYLPLVIAADARHYVRDAILSGEARDTTFKVHGDLWHMPFDKAPQGEFRIEAKVNKVDYAFAPPALMANSTVKWPTLRQLQGDLVFDKASMSLKVSRGLVSDAPGLKVTRATARIADLSANAVVEVDAQIDGSLADALGVVKRSPLSAMTAQALSEARGTGAAAVQFGLNIPLQRLADTTVKGLVSLPGNDIQISPDTPVLARTKGTVEFTDQSFSVPAATTRLVGGDLQFAGGLRPGDDRIRFRGQGTATADGLKQAPFVGMAGQLAANAVGSTAYSAQLEFAPTGPELTVQTQLQGMQLALPPPMDKAAGASWPLSYTSRITVSPDASQTRIEQTTVELADGQAPLAYLSMSRDTSAQPARLLRGVVAVGEAARHPPAVPTSGLHAHIDVPHLPLDEWEAVWSASRQPPSAHGAPATPLQHDYPDRVHVTTPLLVSNGQALQQLQLQVARTGARWQGRLQSKELSGQVAYQPASGRLGAQLHARLTHLSWRTQPTQPASTQARPDAATHRRPGDPGPHTLPALDIEVGSFELDGRQLGALSLRADHLPDSHPTPGWQLSHLSLKVPEAHLTGSGRWSPATSGQRTGEPGARRSELDFLLDIRDTGALLTRFGMPEVLLGGKGQLKGQIAWMGVPYSLHTPSLSGQMNLDLSSGRFLKADPGIAKLLGVLSLQSLPRRLTLDFSDVFSQGFAFDFLRGDARIQQGIASTNNLQMKGPNAAVLMEGTANIDKETQDIRAVVIPELNAGTASLIATVVNPAVGLGTFLAQAFLREPLAKASTRTFHIHGAWSDPQVDRIRTPSGDVGGNDNDVAQPPTPTPPR